MQQAEGLELGAIREFLGASQEMEFVGQTRGEIYAWVEAVLMRQEYLGRTRKQRGLMGAYRSKMTGRSLAPITRLIRQYRQSGRVELRACRRRRFPSKYPAADMALRAALDRAHERLRGPATRRILQRELQEFGKPEFQRLAGISVSHLYNLRRSTAYRQRAGQWSQTRPTTSSIAERRRPEAHGQPGYLRVDTVHQGDWQGVKGVYHINAVDTVTQWEVIGCTARISEQYLLPVLEAILHQFPFRLQGFHADNGSEFVNHRVARLLNKLLVEFTKSRPNHTQDNALVEGKNGAVIRKHIGYGHIPAAHAPQVQRFYMAYLNPYLNYHRPCGFAVVRENARGRRWRVYPAAAYATPYEKLRSLPEAGQYLKPGVSWEQLERPAKILSDTEWARQMSQAKAQLLRGCKVESPLPPRF